MSHRGSRRVAALLPFAVATVAAMGISGLLLHRTTFRAPLVPVLLMWAALAAIGSQRVRRRPWLRRLGVFVAALGLAWAAGELGLLATGAGAPRYTTRNGPLLVADPVFGWSLARGKRVEVDKKMGSETVYRTAYTTDAAGHRRCPSPPPDHPQAVVSFFGGSYTMGTGVADELTLPCRFQRAAAGRYRVDNWGVSRFGPHHMLRALDAGLVQRRVDSKLRHLAVYQALPVHCTRIRAPGWMGFPEPAYQLSAAGGVELGALRRPTTSALGRVAHGIAYRSLLLSGLRRLSYQCEPQDVRLLAEIVVQSRRLLRESYSQSDLIVLLWDGPERLARGQLAAQVLAALRSRNVLALPVSDFVTDFDESDPRFIPGDGHPTGATHGTIARQLVGVVDRLE